MSSKKSKRLRRARKVRANLKLHGKNRLCIFRTSQHIYAQIISPDGAVTLASASTLEPEVRSQLKYGGNAAAAAAIGTRIAAKAKELKIQSVGFDRSGHRFHGRVKALADAAREAGLVI